MSHMCAHGPTEGMHRGEGMRVSHMSHMHMCAHGPTEGEWRWPRKTREAEIPISSISSRGRQDCSRCSYESKQCTSTPTCAYMRNAYAYDAYAYVYAYASYATMMPTSIYAYA